MQEEDPSPRRSGSPVPPPVPPPGLRPTSRAPNASPAEPLLSLEDLEFLPSEPAVAGPSGSAPPPLRSTEPNAIAPRAPLRRDRILVIGRRRAGKTIFLARLYEALWKGARIVDGRLVRSKEEAAQGGTRISCRATSGEAHARLMRIVEELQSGKWPAATLGSSYAELVVNHDGREHVVTAIDYPGEVFRKAFMLDSADPDAVELRDAVDRAAAAILVADPAVVATGGEESHEDSFGLMQAALRIRGGPDGALVPIAIVFTKCDVNGAFLREVGGTRAFARQHFAQLFEGVERTSVFPCAAVRSATSPLGRAVPDASRPPENVVDPLDAVVERLDEARVAAEREQRRSTVAWVVFAVAVAMLLAAVAAAAIYVTTRR